jgi:hypothetical protein
MEIFEVFPIVSFRGMSTGMPIFGPEIDQKVGKTAANCCTSDFLLCSGGDLNPLSGFCFPLFSMVFPCGISIRVAICGKEWNQNCSFLSSIYLQSFHVF